MPRPLLVSLPATLGLSSVHSTERSSQGPIAGQLLLEDTLHQITGFTNLHVGQSVVHRRPLAACDHYATFPQYGQMLGDVGLGQGEGFHELAHGLLTVAQLVDNHETLRMRHGLADIRLQCEEALSVILHPGTLLSVYSYARILQWSMRLVKSVYHGSDTGEKDRVT